MKFLKRFLIKNRLLPVKITTIKNKKEMNIELWGYTGTFLSCIYMLPQVIKVIETGSTGDLSIAFLFIFFISSIIWLIYGILLKSIPLIIADVFHLTSSIIIILFKLNVL